MTRCGPPDKQGLYDPAFEQDGCGIGLAARLNGGAGHDIVHDALRMLRRMDHRGARGADPDTGDGAGVLIGLPDAFLRVEALRLFRHDLPQSGDYAVGMVFFPQCDRARSACREILTHRIAEHGLDLIGWRRVPTDAEGAGIGADARATMPVVEQLFIAAGADFAGDADALERELYTLRKQAYHEIKGHGEHAGLGIDGEGYYVCSLSPRVLVYKGQLTPDQLGRFYPDLADERLASHVALVHSRFSTNTFPSWERAQPMRVLCHNGEINTIRANVNAMRARQASFRSDLFGDNLRRLMPVVDPLTSDSGMFDNVLEFLTLSGRSLPEALMMMVPEAWENDHRMDADLRDFYAFHAHLMEPWDGPAALAFCDGRLAGAMLDRNGLRPARWLETADGCFYLASEAGVVDVPAARVTAKGRLAPGDLVLLDFAAGRRLDAVEAKGRIARRRAYGRWLCAELPMPEPVPVPREDDNRLAAQHSFGYTREHLEKILVPMAAGEGEPVASMGQDAALAVLSTRPRPLYDYFKQLFAQVTNPPIDPIREARVMSLGVRLGPEGNLLATRPGQCRRLRLERPLLDEAECNGLAEWTSPDFGVASLDTTWQPSDAPEMDGDALCTALDALCRQAAEKVIGGAGILILDDRRFGLNRVPIPAALALGAVHQHLLRRHLRTRTSLVVAAGDAREVHHVCVLLGYGADAVCPWLALRTVEAMDDERLPDDPARRREQVLSALATGVLKVMSKMGISTLSGYRGAQIFEALGLGAEVVERAFSNTASRLGGIGFDLLAGESVRRHAGGWPADGAPEPLDNPGETQWRVGGERHAVTPTSIASLRQAAMQGDREAFRAYITSLDDRSARGSTLRGLLAPRTRSRSLPLAEIESAEAIMHRFRTGAMSLGALSREAHETLAVAMNRIGGRSNSGEGGEDPARFIPDAGGDSRNSAIKQIASGRFGVTAHYLAHADRLQIKIAQGAKPGEGGQLPGFKVTPEIARLRCATPGVGLISPPPHHDIYSIEDLAQLIFDLKNANPDASVSVKLVSASGTGTVAAGVAKAHADHILISGHDGGTGAAPLSSIQHAGLPWELGLAEVHQTLVMNDLRGRVVLETDGGLRTGRDVIIAACLGAEEYGFATTAMIAMGCIMMRKCHLNTCPVGICTQDPELRRRFSGQPEHVVNYLWLVAEHVREYLAALGVPRLMDLVGRADLLRPAFPSDHPKAATLDFSGLLTPASKLQPRAARRHTVAQDHGLDTVLDRDLIRRARPALEGGKSVRIDMAVTNADRAVGGLLSHAIIRRHGVEGLPDGSIDIHLAGTAGQSLGAWLVPGINLVLTGEANDYVGKGLSGGRIIVRPTADCGFEPGAAVILGNVCLYGASGGELFARGSAAERFAVRNAGASAVVEGLGDHGCEYMSGGTVVVLGRIGGNFAAGMTGGLAYIWDPHGREAGCINPGSVAIETLVGVDEIRAVGVLIARHAEWTGSRRARKLAAAWPAAAGEFLRVLPHDYRRVLEQAEDNSEAAPAVIHG